MRRALATAIAVIAFTLTASPSAHAASSDLPPALPLYVAGHLLAPVGKVVGLVLVEPLVFLIENVPVVFELD